MCCIQMIDKNLVVKDGGILLIVLVQIDGFERYYVK